MNDFLRHVLATYRGNVEMNAELADQFLLHISSIMLNARFSDDSFLYDKRCDSEPKTPLKSELQCCTHVHIGNNVRRCYMKGTKLDKSPFVGCEEHTLEYKRLRERKEITCKQAQDAFDAFNKSSNVENAERMLRNIYECLETRVIIMHRYFRPYTECENAYEGHVKALQWFTLNVLQKALNVIREKSSKALEQEAKHVEPEAQPLLVEQDTEQQPKDKEEEKKAKKNAKKRAAQKKKKEQKRDQETKKSEEAILFMEMIYDYEKSNENAKTQIETQTNSINSVKISDEIPIYSTISFESFGDGTHKFAYNQDHELINKMFKQYLENQFKVQTPMSWTLTCVVEEYKSIVTNKLAFKRSKLYGLFQIGNIVGIGKWNVEEEDYLKANTITCPATFTHRVSQTFIQATVVFVNLNNRPDLNGEQGIVKKVREDGKYEVKVLSTNKQVVVSSTKVKPDSALPNVFGPINELGNVALWPATPQGVIIAKHMFMNALHEKWKAPDYVIISKEIAESHHGDELNIKLIDQSVFDKKRTHTSTLAIEASTVPNRDMKNHETLTFTFGGKKSFVNNEFVNFSKYVSHETSREYRRRDTKITNAFQQKMDSLLRELGELQSMSD